MEEPRGWRDPGRTRSRDCRRGRGAADARHHAPAGVGSSKHSRLEKASKNTPHSRRPLCRHTHTAPVHINQRLLR